MKKCLCFLICFAFVCSLYGQKIFKIPEQVPEQIDKRAIHAQWNIISSAINFAKSQGFTPDEYGSYTGNLLAAAWNIENGFTGFGQEVIYNWDTWRTNDDSPIFIIQETDKSLVLKIPVNGLKEYFSEKGDLGVSFDEMIEFMRGMEKQIAAYSGCTFELEVEDEWSPCTTTWYPFAVINIIKKDLSSELESVSSGN